MHDAHDHPRRTLLQTLAAGLAAGAIGLPARANEAPVDAKGKKTASGSSAPSGKPGDFDFLTGEWKIHHRQLKTGTKEWIEFDGDATCWSILGGIAHIEELRIPARDFSGMGLRLLDLQSHIWSDFWVNAKSGVLAGAGLTGNFIEGEGIFESRDTENGKTMVYRGVWDRIVPGKSHRWYQAASGDDGKTWDISWTMDWRRA